MAADPSLRHDYREVGMSGVYTQYITDGLLNVTCKGADLILYLDYGLFSYFKCMLRRSY